MSLNTRLGNATLDRARTAWGDLLPDWIEALAEACAVSTQSAVAKRIGYSTAAVNAVLNKGPAYKGNLAAIEQAVRGALMNAEVHCPAFGMAIPADQCRRNQTLPFSNVNPARRDLYRACRGGCPHSHLKGNVHGKVA